MKPNIVVICADQLRFDAVDVSEGVQTHTPALRQLAAQGTRFENCYTPSPVCAPARASMLTGLYPSQHGLWANGVSLPPEVPLASRELADGGYDCGLVGKLHLSAAFEGRTEQRHSDGFSWFRWAHDPSHGSSENAYHAWLRHKHPDIWSDLQHHVVRPGGATPELRKEAFAKVPARAHYSTWVADAATEFIESREDGNPFFLVANFFDPHPPFAVPDEYLEHVDAASVPPPHGDAGDLDDRPAFLKRASGGGYASHLPTFDGQTDESLALLRRTYYAMIKLVDAGVGEILSVLERRGIADSTLVLFTSDHGEMLGDHGLLLKGPMMYEGAVRVPLILRWPGVVPAGRTVDSMVGLHDIASTLRARGNSEALSDDDLDLVDVASGKRPGRTYAASQYRDSCFPSQPPIHTSMFRSGDHKIILWHTEGAQPQPPEGELYDLSVDPHELNNLWHDPDSCAVKLDLMGRLLAFNTRIENRSAPRPFIY